MRPAANTPTMRGTRTTPVRGSTLTSTNSAPKANMAWVLVTGPSMFRVYLSNVSSASGSASGWVQAASASKTPPGASRTASTKGRPSEPPASCHSLRMRAQASRIAEATAPAVREPPATGPVGSALSPSSTLTAS